MLLTEKTKEALMQESGRVTGKRQQKTCKCGRKTTNITGICSKCVCEQCGV